MMGGLVYSEKEHKQVVAYKLTSWDWK